MSLAQAIRDVRLPEWAPQPECGARQLLAALEQIRDVVAPVGILRLREPDKAAFDFPLLLERDALARRFDNWYTRCPYADRFRIGDDLTVNRMNGRVGIPWVLVTRSYDSVRKGACSRDKSRVFVFYRRK